MSSRRLLALSLIPAVSLLVACGGEAPAPLGPSAFGDVGGITLGSKVVGKGSASTDQSTRTGDVPASGSVGGITPPVIIAALGGLVLLVGAIVLLRPRKKSRKK